MHTTSLIATLAAVAVSAGLATSAHAEPPQTSDDSGGVTEFRFEDDLVHGDLVRSKGEILRVRRRPADSSLLRVREHFVDRMLRSAEDL